MTATDYHSNSDRFNDGVHNDGEARQQFLRRAIQWDASIILVVGILLLSMSGSVATFMGLDSPSTLVVSMMAVMLLIYDGGRLAWATMSDSVHRGLAMISLLGNTLWAMASIPLLALEVLPLTDGGWWIMAGLADFAAVFAILQWYGLKNLKR